MLFLDTWEKKLWLAGIVLTGLLVIKMLRTDLYRGYRAFFLFLVFGLARHLFLAVSQLTGNAYGYFYITTETLQLALWAGIVVELYHHVFLDYPGVKMMSRYVVCAALAVALLLAALTLGPDIGMRPNRGLLDVFFIAERGVLSATVILLALVSSFLLLFPLQLPRNALVHVSISAGYFFSKASVLLYRNLTGFQADRKASVAVLAISATCLLLWLGFLQREEEDCGVITGLLRSDPVREAAVLTHLRDINSVLIRLR